MPGRARCEIVASDEVGFYHCYSRCVRQAYLCGTDHHTGKNYDHRKQWIEDRLEFLASAMAVEVAVFAILDNHFHLILRIRPDLVRRWSNREVARRWLTLCPGRRKKDQPARIAEQRLKALMADKASLAESRDRLCSLSWFMKFLNEYIAKRSNREDDVTGCFFDGRFASVQLLDVCSLMVCAAYADLNPVRAGIAKTPETSTHTSAYRRILAWRAQQAKRGARSSDRSAAAWLTPIEVGARPPDGLQAPRGRRASDEGFLPIRVEEYLQLLDWSGREARRDKRGRIPDGCAPILERLEVDPDSWMRGVAHFGEMFANVAGRPVTLRDHAQTTGQLWFRGVRLDWSASED